tara:strand:+ start:817 stop:981 length:165 start_codon:yes stop_codon:yes gene_type:complete
MTINQTVQNIQSVFEDFEEAYNKDDLSQLYDTVEDLQDYLSKLKREIDEEMLNE